ncbi:MAG TPA: phenylalanine--tRNA ligase subunit beta [Steroidobacteraceae bacterium]|nr:phenylalanine--tRNA ligase subunit beta [Steroidobacteraceae bacterium]
MRIPYSWLADWVRMPWAAPELGSRLTMAGFELEVLEAAAPPFSQVFVAEILSAQRHPQADRLQVCKVNAGPAINNGEPLQIVCGAANARAGLKSALAIIGAQLPGNLNIEAAKLRGVDSQGMLASAKELGLAEAATGILELPADAPVGTDLRAYLTLDDPILELNITPNRGDAMSILGIAREVAALTNASITGPAAEKIAEEHPDTFAVHLDAPDACPAFFGCVVHGVNNKAATPVWMKERLRRAGVRQISPVVDITNYVMLELGQPMHAYDLKKLRGDIHVRLATIGESITLLDGKTVKVDPDVLLIADRDGPVSMAGVMGGERTAVNDQTTDVFLEGAYFGPQAVIGRGRRWGLVTDASQRFERGVDPSLQRRAMERAASLVRTITGGTIGTITVTQAPEHLPRRTPVPLRRSRLQQLLGVTVADDRVVSTLTALQMKVEATPEGWRATPPPHRFDVAIEADLIEEVARIVGFDAIPEEETVAPQRFPSSPEERPGERTILDVLVGRGYEEAITFAFVDPELQRRLFPERAGLPLANPIASDLSVMRVSLWPGLLRAALENQRRQQDRVRLFEHGAKFIVTDRTTGATREVDALAGVAAGARLPEQWGVPRDLRAPADFFDVKGDLEALFAATGATDILYEPGELACLHPGRTARILRGGQEIGWLGELHPLLVRELDFTYAPVLFEIDTAAALAVVKPRYREISRFPQVRRDIAVVVDEGVSLSALAERVTLSASSLLQNIRIFDLYRGPGVEAGRKSVALGLIFQDISRTLTDDDVERLIASVVADLRAKLNAKIRE